MQPRPFSSAYADRTARLHPQVFLAIIPLGAALPSAASGQTTLNANSGINHGDTNLVFDLTVSTSGTMTLAYPVWNPTTHTMSMVFNLNPLPTAMHVESGYDSTGNPLTNLYMAASGSDPNHVSVSPVSVARFAQGQVTLFDANIAHIPLVLPSSATNAMYPLSLLGSNPAASIVGQMRVTNIQSLAAVRNAALSIQGNSATIEFPVGAGGQAVWTYLQSGSTWVAQQVQVTVALPNGSFTKTLQFANLATSDNAAADAARGAKSYTVAAPTASNSNQLPAISPGPPSNCLTSSYTNQLGGAQNIAFAHGFTSNPCTWNRMVPWLNGDFIFGTELVAKTSGTDHLATQGADFESQVLNTNKNGFIFVGHSAGGLISRWAAQQLQQSKPNVIRGVVTIDTPHQGSDLLINGQPELAGFLTGISNWFYGIHGCATGYDDLACFFADLTSYGGAEIATYNGVNSVGALADMTPGSTFLNQLNYPAQAENFQQAAIIGETPQRWLVTRVGSEWLAAKLGLNCNPEDPCGERAAARMTESVFDETVLNLLWNLELELALGAQYCDPSYYCEENGYGWAQAIDQNIQQDMTTLGVMEYIDAVFDLTAGCSISALECDGSDGLVRFGSQSYPALSAIQYPIPGADSHGMAPKSPFDHTTMDQILANQFHVQTTVGCTYAPSPATFALLAGGGTETFTIATSAGCPWSVTSQQTWLTINSGATGTSNGTVSFTAQPNPLNIARQASLNIAGAASSPNSASVNVTETGACTYALSPGPEIGVPGTGGTGSITVSTQTGCAWSAVSSAPSWLTISPSSATGTGNGSFQYTAADNTGLSDLTATIAVANQTLTVVQGTAAGTPGIGTVTISGSPQSYTVNECPGNPHGPCNVTFQNSGAVIVTVNGQSYSAYYSGSGSSSASLAASLAAQMNAPSSLISATVSGSTISIKATINGTATDYPLAASYGFDTNDFSAPAFQGTASGPSLTGGTD